MMEKEYTSIVALNELQSEGLIIYFRKKVFDRKAYWEIKWRGEEKLVAVAIGATLYTDESSSVPFGIQYELLRQGKVQEVVLICKKWDWIYRIPAINFRKYRVTQREGRYLFQVNRYGELRSGETRNFIDLENYRVLRVSPTSWRTV